jgi:arylsulfatase A-like enzyme
MRNKKTTLSLILLLIGALALPSTDHLTVFASQKDKSSRPGKPNIIFVLADDLGYGDLSCYGQKKFATPNIDRIAAEGMRFTQVYAGSTVCGPSRCVLMTGLHTGHALVRGNNIVLRPEDVTVAEVLKQANYVTGAFGKWGLGVEGTTGHPNKQGFDEWFGYLDQIHAHSYYPDHLYKNSEKVALDGEQYSHDLIVDTAFKFIKMNKDKPFFLYFSLTIPHASLEVPNDSLKKYLGKYPEEPYSGENYKEQKTPRAAFAAMIDRFDQSVGRMMELLKELGIDEDTIVFVTSDNGPHSAGGGDPKFFNSSGPLRGEKRDLYEGGIRVPMIVRWPGKIRRGAVSNQMWAFWDFLPTAAEIAGVRPTRQIDGISMLPALLGGDQRNHEYLYWEFFRGDFQQAIRFKNWKAIRLERGKPFELYNLDADLGEQNDIAAKHPDVVAQIEKLFKNARSEPADWSMKPDGEEKKTKATDKQAQASLLVGRWNLAYATNEDGGQRQGRGTITLELKMEDGKLTGTAFVIGKGGEKQEWRLISPKFDGKKFAFSVDNGEGVLEGELEYKEGGFEGKWKMAGTELTGILKMTRKE